jgi:hypothetical protein
MRPRASLFAHQVAMAARIREGEKVAILQKPGRTRLYLDARHHRQEKWRREKLHRELEPRRVTCHCGCGMEFYHPRKPGPTRLYLDACHCNRAKRRRKKLRGG